MDCYDMLEPVARKEHKCECCRKIISKGEKYSYEKGLYEGTFFTRKLCLTCLSILRAYIEWDGDYEFTWDGVNDWLSSNHCYGCKKREECEINPEGCELVRCCY